MSNHVICYYVAMHEDFIASEEDLKTIEEGISYVWRSELDYIFNDKSKVKDTVVISYDSKFIYLLGYKKEVEKIPHKIKIPEKELLGWSIGVYFEELKSYLPARIKDAPRNVLPRICGSLLTPMIETQKKREREHNAYTTKESYLATIVHEFGHVYFNSFKNWYFSNLDNNLLYMNKALVLFESSALYDKNAKSEKLKIQLPLNYSISEIYAFCTDYSAAAIFWPKHKQDIDKMQAANIKKVIEKESKLNIDEEDSYLSDEKSGHHLRAAVIGRILLDKYPRGWPERLIELNTF